MKEYPILFNSFSVNAIFAGRKTQTRRVIKPQPTLGKLRFNGAIWQMWLGPNIGHDVPISPYGKIGGVLWVKETWAAIWPDLDPVPLEKCNIEYKADTLAPYPGGWPAEDARGNPDAPKWRPSIYMPKWAARLWLEITEIRIEPLHSIVYEDLKAEGITDRLALEAMSKRDWPDAHAAAYSLEWDKINKKNGHIWATNPWVWVITFKKLPERPRGL